MGAWLYLNLELERQEEVKDVLEHSGEEEFAAFKQYLALKQCGVPVELDSYI